MGKKSNCQNIPRSKQGDERGVNKVLNVILRENIEIYFWTDRVLCLVGHVWIVIEVLLLPQSTSTFWWIMALQGPFSALADNNYFSASYNVEKSRNTDLHVFLAAPGIGGPHPIFLSRQKKQARDSFLSEELSDTRFSRITPSWQLLDNLTVAGFKFRSSWQKSGLTLSEG